MSHHKSCFFANEIVDMVGVFICPPGEDGCDSDQDSGDEAEEGQYKYLLQF